MPSPSKKAFFSLSKLLYIGILITGLYGVESSKSEDRSYLEIKNPIPCVRRFNSTHQIGCGNLDATKYAGAVFAVRNQTEFDRLFFVIRHLGIKNQDQPIVVVVVSTFYSKVVDLYKTQSIARRIINGIVLVNKLTNSSRQKGQSDDSTSPNQRYGIQQNNTNSIVDWNPSGTAFMFDDFPVPFYIITEPKEASKAFDSCYDRYNAPIFARVDANNNEKGFAVSASESLCGMQLGLEQYGAVNSEVCTRRGSIQHTVESNQFCDPLGGSTYMTFASGPPQRQKPVSLLTARLDSFTMFEYFTPGANEPISGIIGLLALADFIAKKQDTKIKNNVMLVLFDNDALDLAGSQRFVDDLKKAKLPKIPTIENSEVVDYVLTKDNMTTLIELTQLGTISSSSSNSLWIHRDPVSYALNSTQANRVEKLTDQLRSLSNGKIDSVKDKSQPLSPGSVHSFLRESSLSGLGGISVAGFDKPFRTTQYHSVFDTPQNMNITYPDNENENNENYTTEFAKRLQPLLTSIGKTLVDDDEDDEVDKVVLNKLVYCFYQNVTCPFFRSIMTNNEWSLYTQLLANTQPAGHLSFFTSVWDTRISGKLISYLSLRYLSRDRRFDLLPTDQCSRDSQQAKDLAQRHSIPLPRTILAIGGSSNSTTQKIKCMASSVYSTSAVSPAFAKFMDGKLERTDEFPAWTESSWASTEVQMKLFMYASQTVRRLTLVVGVLMSVTFVIVTVLVKKYAHKWMGFQELDDEDKSFSPEPTNSAVNT